MGLELKKIEEVGSEGVKVAMLLAGDTKIELLEPLKESSSIAKHLDKRGEGIHHICLEVEDLAGAIKNLREKGADLIEPAPRTGAGGRNVAFVNPGSTGRVLVELVEKSSR